jgi:DNA-binding NtrC family response regulator
MLRALVVEDDPLSMKSLARLLDDDGFTANTAGTLQEARDKWGQEKPHLLLSDLMLPDGSSIDFLKEIEIKDGGAPGPQIVLITGHATVDTVIEAFRLGVSDYLTKPVDVPRLKAICANVKRTHRLKEEIGELEEELLQLGRFGKLVGQSPAMQRVYELIKKVAPTDATVLLTGERGTGKDVAAQTVYRRSKRRMGPYVPINCGAVSPNLIESELFGHEKGSFTGASRSHRGYFERANGGTLFLDEITEMPLELQVKLLRVLETGALLRIGGDEPVHVDVRVIAASNRRLEEAIHEGKLREDLLDRLNVFPIELPPLRERGEDIEQLAEQFLAELNKAESPDPDGVRPHKRLTEQAFRRLSECPWPGNVRELKNVIHRAFILADKEIGPECLSCGPAGVPMAGAASLSFRLGTPLPEVERRVILATLDHCGGDKRKTAEVLDLSLRTLYYRLNSYSVPTEGSEPA